MGGIVALVIICGLVVFFLIRRKRKSRLAAPGQEHHTHKRFSKRQEMDGTGVRYEMNGKTQRAELAGIPIHEMEGSHQR